MSAIKNLKPIEDVSQYSIRCSNRTIHMSAIHDPAEEVPSPE